MKEDLYRKGTEMDQNGEPLVSHRLKSGIVRTMNNRKKEEETDPSIDTLKSIHLRRGRARPVADQEKDVHLIVDRLRIGPDRRGEPRRL